MWDSRRTLFGSLFLILLAVSWASPLAAEETKEDRPSEVEVTAAKPEEVSKQVEALVDFSKAQDEFLNKKFGVPVPKAKTDSEARRALESAKTEAELKAFVDHSLIAVGDPVRLTLELDRAEDVRAEFPPVPSELGGFAVKASGSSKPEKSGQGRVRESRWLILESFVVGSYVIPPETVRLILPNGEVTELKSQEVFIEIKSLIAKDAKEELRDIKPQAELPSRLSLVWLIVLFLGVLGMLGSGLFLYFAKFQKREAPSPGPLPDEAALRELERISSAGLLERGEAKEFYYLVSNCLRRYIEARFRIPAEGRTSEEFLSASSTMAALESGQVSLLRAYLDECDLVKYAKFTPSSEMAQRLIQTTRRFIEETRPKPPEPTGGVS